MRWKANPRVCRVKTKSVSILEDSGLNIKKTKEVKEYIVINQIRDQQYEECLFNKKIFIHGMDVLRSIGHQVYGQHLNKASLSLFDSKRFILAKGIDTLGYGYH